ncbi:prolyl oligopeptidase family serine peptidase [Chitinophaga horti]|uniref:Prolyl oligopeptidase family serine peptidase n=1 Tax=Chitinophaga horti TaxID=2920382 RepID=A0ABY6J6Q7_9BACT|nr:prolyl oligopeptidase family serine peptidase [Chitinophaga horti]UYQ95373.1 prolyl oligopeptidase family serine peptidase [Chitinophaga horti]
MKALLPLLLALTLGATSLKAQQTAEKFVLETKYLLALPEGYGKDTSQRWPLVIFLHGAGETGLDLNKVKMHGPPKLVEAGKNFPFILVSPQTASFGWQPDVLYQLLQSLKKQYRVDNDRIYLTGLSMGGFGTWALGMKHPEEFAAIAPICGGGDTANIWRLRYTPVWCFHGAKDEVVPLTSSQKMVNALKQYNSNVQFTIYPEAAHDSWTATYDDPAFYTWLLAQRKHRFQPVKVDAKTLAGYNGRYTNRKNDTLTITSNGTSLDVKAPGHTLQLKAASPTVFYWEASAPIDVEFTKTGFVLRAEEREVFRKIK